jgi:hypothetical protein
MTPEEEAAAAAAAKAQHDARIAQSLAWHPTVAGQRQAEREVARQRDFDEQWPDPRQSLRAAHDELRSAEATLTQHRDQARAARAHVTEREAAVERAQQVVETARREATARLRERLAGNGGALPDGDDPAEAAAMRDAERARRLLAVAQAALTEIEASVKQAEDEVGRAKQQIEKAAQALIEKTRQDVQAEWGVAQQRAADLQTRMIGLRVDTRYSSANWPANLRKLLVDAEAVI